MVYLVQFQLTCAPVTLSGIEQEQCAPRFPSERMMASFWPRISSCSACGTGEYCLFLPHSWLSVYSCLNMYISIKFTRQQLWNLSEPINWPTSRYTRLLLDGCKKYLLLKWIGRCSHFRMGIVTHETWSFVLSFTVWQLSLSNDIV